MIEASFPDSSNRHFVIFEGVLPATTNAECLANTDFSSLVPADPSRTAMSFDPGSGVWYLRNSNAGGSTLQGCRAVFADGGAVDANDYSVWRSRFGSTLFARDENIVSGSDGSRPRPPATAPPATTYVFSPVVRNQ